VQRGPYLIGAVLEEAGGSHIVEGSYLDLLDPQLRIVRQRELGPGQLTWLRDLTYDKEPLLASSGRVVNWEHDQTGIRFTCEAPRGVQVTTVLRVPAQPATVRADGADIDLRYDADTGVLWLRHPGTPTGTHVVLEF